MRLKISIAILLNVIGISSYSQNWHDTNPVLALPVNNPVYKAGWTLIFEDEFSGSFDANFWKTRQGWVENADPLDTGSYVFHNNLSFTANTMVLKCVYSDITFINESNVLAYYDYTGTSVESIVEWGPGYYYETRCKRNGLGSKSSFWIYNYVSNEDFSVFDNEFSSIADMRKIHMNFSEGNNVNDYNFDIPLHNNMPPQDQEYYTYGVDWGLDGEIKIYINNHLVAKHTSYEIDPGFINFWCMPLYWQPEYLRAEGQLEVDYFRIYEKNCEKQVSIQNFGTQQNYNNQNERPRLIGDINGDNISDIIAFSNTYTKLSYGQANGNYTFPINCFNDYTREQGYTSQNARPRMIGDVNGDGRDDIIAFGINWTTVRLGLPNGGFGSKIFAINDYTVEQGWTDQEVRPRFIADVNGDGRVDIIGFGYDYTKVSLGQSNGTFGSPLYVLNDYTVEQNFLNQNIRPRLIGDINGDGRADIVAFGPTYTTVNLGLSNGYFGPKLTVQTDYTVEQGYYSQQIHPRLLGDINGDGRDDLITFNNSNVTANLGKANGTLGPKYNLLNQFTVGQGWSTLDQYPRMLADVNGDCKDDLIGFGQGETKISISTTSFIFPSFSNSQNVIDDFSGAEGWTSQNVFPRFICDINGDNNNDIIGFGFDKVFTLSCINSTTNVCPSSTIVTPKSPEEEFELSQTNNNLKIFPNPSSEQIEILNSYVKGEIEIIDLTGKIVFSKKYENENQKLNISFLENGTYLLKNTNELGEFQLSKFIIIH